MEFSINSIKIPFENSSKMSLTHQNSTNFSLVLHIVKFFTFFPVDQSHTEHIKSPRLSFQCHQLNVQSRPNTFMHLCCFSLITSEIFQLTNRHRYQFIVTDILSTKELIRHATLWIPKLMEKLISISIAFSVDILIRNKNLASEEHKTKTKRFKIILHVE